MADHTDEKTIDAAETAVLNACNHIRRRMADAIEAGHNPATLALAMLIVGRQVAADVWGDFETQTYFRLVADALGTGPANEPEVTRTLQ